MSNVEETLENEQSKDKSMQGLTLPGGFSAASTSSDTKKETRDTKIRENFHVCVLVSRDASSRTRKKQRINKMRPRSWTRYFTSGFKWLLPRKVRARNHWLGDVGALSGGDVAYLTRR